MNEGLFTNYDAAVAQETINSYYTGTDLSLPYPEDFQETLPEQTTGLSITLPQGWWVILLMAILLNLSINLLLNRTK